MDSAAINADSVLKARDALDAAISDASDAVAWKGSKLSVDASYAGDLSPEPAKPGASLPYSLGASLTVPVLSTLSASASAKLDGSYSGSLSWSPLAVDQGGISARYALAKAELAYTEAKRQARLDALSSFAQTLSAEAQVRAALTALDKANSDLTIAQASHTIGELSNSALAKARAAQPRAQAAYRKAQAQLASARATLALKIGGELGSAITAGAPLDASSVHAALGDSWQAPAYSPGRAVLEAKLALAQAEDASLWSGSGPVSLSGSLSGDGAFSLRGSVSLDWKTLAGSSVAKRQNAIASAELALANALAAGESAYEEALLSVDIAELSLIEAQANLELARTEEAQARVLFRLGEILPGALADAEAANAEAQLKLELAAIELARSRLAFE
jgi:outer membrane protein TolC